MGPWLCTSLQGIVFAAWWRVEDAGPARLSLSQGRGVNSRLYCCPGLPGFPRENIRGDIDIVEKRNAELFIEQVERRGEERMRGGVWERSGELNTTRKESESRWQSVFSVADSIQRSGLTLSTTPAEHDRASDFQHGLLVQKLTKYTTSHWFMGERVHAEVRRAQLKGSETEQKEYLSQDDILSI